MGILKMKEESAGILSFRPLPSSLQVSFLHSISKYSGCNLLIDAEVSLGSGQEALKVPVLSNYSY